MMVVRHTNHGEYDGRPIPAAVLDRLQDCCVEQSIAVLLTPDESIRQKVAELVVRADAVEFADPAFREEPGHWIGQGVFGTSWLMSKRSSRTWRSSSRIQTSIRSTPSDLASPPRRSIARRG